MKRITESKSTDLKKEKLITKNNILMIFQPNIT